MQTVSFSFPTNIRFGRGVVQELGPWLKSKGLSKPLIVADPIVTALPFMQQIRSNLRANGCLPEVYAGISKNPVEADVIGGGECYETAGCDCIVGVGGGASLDVARAIALRINNRRPLLEYDELIGGDLYITEPIPPFVTIPTTSGTGSEVGRSAIIGDDEEKRKRILFHPSLMALQVFADPALTDTMPPHVTAATGMDALTHNIEAFLARNWHPMAEGIALQGIRMITGSLRKASSDGDPADPEMQQARAEMLMASMMGAVAFQKGLGIVHSLAHPLSAKVDMHHGLANAIMLPYGMEFNAPGMEDQFLQLGQAMGLTDQNPETIGDSVVEALRRLNRELELPSSLRDAGLAPELAETLADLAFADFCHPNNPRPVNRDDFLSIYEKALA